MRRWLGATLLLAVAGGAAADLGAAWAAQLRGDVVQATALIDEDASELGEADPVMKLTAASLRLAGGYASEARELLSLLLPQADSPFHLGAVVLDARATAAEGDAVSARATLQTVIAAGPTGPFAPAAHLLLVELQVDEGAYEAAVATLRGMQALGPSPEYELATALVHPDRGHADVVPFPSPAGLLRAGELPGRRAPSFTLQLGAYRDQDNADYMLRALEADGVAAWAEGTDGVIRIFTERGMSAADAGASLRRLQTLGYDGFLVTERTAVVP